MSRRREGRQDRAQPARPSGLLQRKCACGRQTIAGGECDSCREARLLQRAPASPAPAPAVPPIVGEVLRTPGQPLDAAMRAYMEPRFGHYFGDVQVHTGAQAAESAAAVDALAYTVGRDVVFGQGQYRPDSAEGRQLLAHELAHVVQQSRGGMPPAIDPSSTLEQAANQVASQIQMNAETIEVAGSSATGISRAPVPESDKTFQLRHHGLTNSERDFLLKLREKLIKKGEKAIVGALISEDGKLIAELRSGGRKGGYDFFSHIEGKSAKIMEERGITRATLLAEREPCQVCDRSVYPAEEGPSAPLRSSRTGKEISRQTPKVNSSLPEGYVLTVVDPESASYYRGLKRIGSSGAMAAKLPSPTSDPTRTAKSPTSITDPAPAIPLPAEKTLLSPSGQGTPAQNQAQHRASTRASSSAARNNTSDTRNIARVGIADNRLPQGPSPSPRSQGAIAAIQLVFMGINLVFNWLNDEEQQRRVQEALAQTQPHVERLQSERPEHGVLLVFFYSQFVPPPDSDIRPGAIFSHIEIGTGATPSEAILNRPPSISRGLGNAERLLTS